MGQGVGQSTSTLPGSYNPYSSGTTNTLAGLSLGGDIASLLGGIGQNNANNAAISSLTGGLNSVLGSESSVANSLLGSYQNFTQPELQQLITQLGPQASSLLGLGTSSLGTAGSYGSQLGQIAGQQAQQSPFTTDQAGVASQLQNFQALTPQQIGLLSTQAGNAVNSAAKTMAAQSGGVANPALLAQQQANQAGQTTLQSAQGLGAMVGQEQLSALQSAGNLFGSAAGQNLAGLNAASSSLGNAGSLFSNIGSTQIGAGQSLYGDELSGLGLSTQGLTTGANLLGNISNTYAQQLSAANQAKASQPSLGSQIGGFLGSVGSLAALF